VTEHHGSQEGGKEVEEDFQEVREEGQEVVEEEVRPSLR
jgi:hypothetical protein